MKSAPDDIFASIEALFSFPEPALPFSSETGKESPLPVPLEKGNQVLRTKLLKPKINDSLHLLKRRLNNNP